MSLFPTHFGHARHIFPAISGFRASLSFKPPVLGVQKRTIGIFPKIG